MQVVVGDALVKGLAKVTNNYEHKRRLMRCLIRAAARIAISAFGEPVTAAKEFKKVAEDMFSEEANNPPCKVPWL